MTETSVIVGASLAVHFFAPRPATGGRAEEGLGHRGGVLRGLIQDPACGLPRMPIPRTPVNKGEMKGRSL
jgi:hypothetical protein